MFCTWVVLPGSEVPVVGFRRDAASMCTSDRGLTRVHLSLISHVLTHTTRQR